MTIFTRARRCFTSGQRYFDKFRRAKILFLDEGTREWLARKHETRAVIKRVNSINSNASFSMMVMVSKRVETEKNEKTTTISRSVYSQSGLQKLREKYMYTCTHVAATASWMTQNIWIILSRRLYFEMRHVVFDDSKRSRASELSKSRPDLLGTGKIIILPELWQKFLAEKNVNASSTPIIFP